MKWSQCLDKITTFGTPSKGLVLHLKCICETIASLHFTFQQYIYDELKTEKEQLQNLINLLMPDKDLQFCCSW